ncbi:MAG: SRPBCC family protein, partial [Acidobacteriales bacterium]|nr:SRPBCC family protein [Terriglobales bacterium]
MAYAQSQNRTQERIANGLGWFSIGLGLAEVVAPGKLAELIGIKDKNGSRALLRIYGAREIAAGIGILSQPRPSGWMWSRVAGDLVDLTSLGSAMASRPANRIRLGTATAAVLGVTALDVLCARELSNGDRGLATTAAGRLTKAGAGLSKKAGPATVRKTVIIDRSPEDVYQFWRELRNLPSFMNHLESIEITGDNRSHWIAKGIAGKTVEWDAEITADEPNHQIAWRSLEGSDVAHSGSVRFERARGGRGTLVRVEMRYSPPAGAIGANVAKLFRAEPGQQIDQDLR